MGSDSSKNTEYSDPKVLMQVQITKAQANFILPQEIKVNDPGDPVHSIDLGEQNSCDFSIIQSEMLSKVSTSAKNRAYQNQRNHLKGILKKDDNKDNYSKIFNEEAKFVRFSVQKNPQNSHKKQNHRRKIQVHWLYSDSDMRIQRQLL